MMTAFMIGSFGFNTAAAEDAPAKIIIPLSFPREHNTPMRAGPTLTKPEALSGNIIIGISKRPTAEEIEGGRYLAEYFIDDTPIANTKGVNSGGILSFDIAVNTGAYSNGPHKLIVNFWDEKGSSAIGMRDIIISNPDITGR